MKRFICTLVVPLFLTGIIFASSGKVTVLLRPSFSDLSSDTSRGAVLVSLSSYVSNDVRYRLYNGSKQFDCWDEISGKFQKNKDYSSGPVVPGYPSGTSVFWIIYCRGQNNSVSANYRDRIGPGYEKNNNTLPLPDALPIEESFYLSGNVLPSFCHDLNNRYAVLVFSGNNLISAASTEPGTGNYCIAYPADILIDRLEVRSLDDKILAVVDSSWNNSSFIGNLQLTDPVNPGDASLKQIIVNGMPLSGFSETRFNYTFELPVKTITIPFLECTPSEPLSRIELIQATKLAGDSAERTTVIKVMSPDSSVTLRYLVTFNPVILVRSLKEFRNGENCRKYLYEGEAVITYLNKFRSQKFIQDGSGAVMIDDPGGIITTHYNQGDVLTSLTGEKSIYRDQTLLIPSEDPGMPVSTGDPIKPISIPVGNLIADPGSYESCLVRISGVSFPDAGQNFKANASYRILAGNAEMIFRTCYEDPDYIGTEIPRTADITGVITRKDNIVQITPRSSADIEMKGSGSCLDSIFIDGIPLNNFAHQVLSYYVPLQAGKNDIPFVECFPQDPDSRVEILYPSDIQGTEKDRIVEIIVTSADGSVCRTYTITFFRIMLQTGPGEKISLNVFPVPARDEITITGLKDKEPVEISNAAGIRYGIFRSTGNAMKLKITGLPTGAYIIRAGEYFRIFLKE